MNPGQSSLFRKALAAALVLLFLAGVGTAVILKLTEQERATAARVRALLEAVDENYLWQTNAAFDELQAMGGAAYPELRAILAWRETALHRAYEKSWGRAPARVRNLFPQPGRRRVLQVKVSGVVPELGPAACRGVTSAAAEYILRNDHSYGTIFPLRMLCWSVPESPLALRALEHWLSRWDRETHLFGMLYAYELWPRMPQLAPALAQWLRNPDVASEAAASLAKLGRGAEFAVPRLVEMAARGVVGTNTNMVVIGIDRPMDRNRVAALHALGSIGVTTAAVREIIETSMRDQDLDVAVAALMAAGQLGLELDHCIPAVLDRWPLVATHETKALAEKLGALGARARVALPWLRKLAADAPSLPAPAGIRRRPPAHPQELEVAAVSAICQIDRGEIAARLPILMKHFAGRWEAVDALLKLGAGSQEIVQGVTPLLQHQFEITRLQAAMVILKHDPAHEKARSILKAGMAAADPEMSLTAAFYHCRVELDPEPLIPLLRKGLLAEGDVPQTALNSVELMGERARPLIPELKRCIAESKNSGSRDWAGRILRRIAPEAMPPML